MQHTTQKKAKLIIVRKLGRFRTSNITINIFLLTY